MSSIDGISISISLQPAGPAAPGQATRPARVTEHEREDDDGERVRHGHEHGHGDSRGQGSLQNALMQALQSLGLMGSSATTNPTTPAASTGTGTAGTTTPAASTPATGPAAAPAPTASAADTLKADMRSFMHALFQAVRAAQPAAPGTSTAASASTGTTPVATGSEATPAPSASAANITSATNITININIGTQSGYGGHSRFGEHQGRRMQFAGGLGAVISQVSNNQAPTQLQDAFAKVLADLQPAAPASSAGGTGTGTSVTLQALLTQLQQNLGYGAAGSASPVGNSVNSVA